jgi:hypothetical protein
LLLLAPRASAHGDDHSGDRDQDWEERAARQAEEDEARVRGDGIRTDHNVGRDDDALLRLRRIIHLAEKYPLAINGLYCLRAWIRVQRGELDAARADLARIAADPLAMYAAELCYTRAALEREAGNLEAARRLAETGLKRARTASSERNGQFVLAGILALSGQAAGARDLFDRAVQHSYRGQGGDGLWRFAAFPDSTREHQEAARVLGLLIERDPESFHAKRAREKLALLERG